MGHEKWPQMGENDDLSDEHMQILSRKKGDKLMGYYVGTKTCLWSGLQNLPPNILNKGHTSAMFWSIGQCLAMLGLFAVNPRNQLDNFGTLICKNCLNIYPFG